MYEAFHVHINDKVFIKSRQVANANLGCCSENFPPPILAIN